ncbi:MAG: hypothetical protein KDJ52_18320 [Anaerolineae bacterium]|nr:hypothetical protein [Anaerolineae bacterium]
MPISYRDAISPYEFRFPNFRRRPDVFNLGQTFITCEQSRPLAQQTPFTPIIIDLFQRLLAAENDLKRAERERKSASSELKRLLVDAKEIVMTMWKSVTAKCSNKPYQATRWGFEYKARTGNVLLPQTFDERLETMNLYIAEEQRQPQADRFTIPDLVDVMSLYNDLEAHHDARVSARRTRENQVELCNALALELSNYLQAAGIHLLAMEFKFKISKELQNWGYDVVAKRRESSTREADGGEAAPLSAPTTNGTVEAAPEDVDGDH